MLGILVTRFRYYTQVKWQPKLQNLSPSTGCLPASKRILDLFCLTDVSARLITGTPLNSLPRPTTNSAVAIPGHIFGAGWGPVCSRRTTVRPRWSSTRRALSSIAHPIRRSMSACLRRSVRRGDGRPSPRAHSSLPAASVQPGATVVDVTDHDPIDL